MQIVKRCGGFPLVLQVVARSLCGLPVEIWKSRLLEWSEGQSILESGAGLLDCLQSSLASLKDKLKECFMDLGSFPEDKKIPVTALIDMWAELYKPDKNGVHAISRLIELSLQSLLNLVVTRYGGDYLFLICLLIYWFVHYSLQFLLFISYTDSIIFSHKFCHNLSLSNQFLPVPQERRNRG